MAVYMPRTRIALASSFEGIVNNGATECALTSLNAYQKMRPGSFFGRIIEPAEFGEYVGTPTVAAFLALRPLVGTAPDYHTVLRMLEMHPERVRYLLDNPDKRDAYEFFTEEFERIKAETEEERVAFGKSTETSEFYRERERMKKADYRAWFGTQRPYPNSIRELRKLVETQRLQGEQIVSGFVPWFATSKDEETTFDLCRIYTDLGLLDLRDVSEIGSGVCIITRPRIIGSQTTTDKLQQLMIIAKREDVPKNQVLRLNDRYDPKEQQQLADAGFRRQIMVTGGYVFPHDVQRAREDPLLVVVERDNMAEEIARYAQALGL